MCGIVGAVWAEPQGAVTLEQLRAMRHLLTHRGPDEAGEYYRPFSEAGAHPHPAGVALGFRRLSIIDIAGGSQPRPNEDGRVQVVFNGEIYNYRQLRRRLEATGHRFETESDTEVIAHLYEDVGAEVFSHLNGMFAIAIWDSRHQRLVLGRDRLGQKPLVYALDDRRLAFASELKSLLQLPGLDRSLDPNAIDDYLLYQYVPHPNTIFRSIRKLPPGCAAVWERGKLEITRYWNPEWNCERVVSRGEACEELDRLLTSAVELRLQADVPLGAFLSGGIDSSLIVALMTRLSDRPIKTFSIGFDQPEYDETSHARLVAEHLGTEHHEYRVTPDAIEVLPKLIWHYDEPFADSSAIPTWYVSQWTRQHVTVALSGDGGDELFAGYQRYRAIKLGAMIDRLGPIRALLGASWWQKLPSSTRQKNLLRRWKRFTSAVSKPAVERYLEWIAIFHESQRCQLYRDGFVQSLEESDPMAFVDHAWQRVRPRDAVTCGSLADLQTYLPCDLMTKTDIASMAHGLEVRQPFLDYRIAEFAIGLPVSHKVRRWRGKQILRDTFGGRLPESIWNRSKMGFGVPLDHWFRNELREMVHDVLLGPSSRLSEWFDPSSIRTLVEQHVQNQFDHSYRLWALLVLELWLREWVPSQVA